MSREVNRLIVLGSTVTALAIVRNSHQMRLPCVLIDTQSGPATLSRLAEVKVLDDDDDEAALAAVVRQASDTTSALIADSDRWLRWIMRHRDALEAKFHLVLHPPNSVLEICINKTQFIRWCKEKALPAPNLFDIYDKRVFSSIEFPVLVRPELTRHGVDEDLPKALEVSTASQLSVLLERYVELGVAPNVCQSLLRPNVEQYSVGVACNDKGANRVFVAKKLRPAAESCAGGTYVVASPDEQVASLVVDAVQALDLYGIAEIEVLKDVDTGELYLLEVNARPWVQYALAVHSGFDFLRFLIRSNSYDFGSETQYGKRWLSFADDLYTVFSRSEGMLASRKIGFWEYLRTLMSANVFSLWNWRDPMPYLVSMRRLLQNSIKRND